MKRFSILSLAVCAAAFLSLAAGVPATFADHYVSDGMGGFVGPDGHHVSDGMGGLIHPDGSSSVSDGMGGFVHD